MKDLRSYSFNQDSEGKYSIKCKFYGGISVEIYTHAVYVKWSKNDIGYHLESITNPWVKDHISPTTDMIKEYLEKIYNCADCHINNRDVKDFADLIQIDKIC